MNDAPLQCIYVYTQGSHYFNYHQNQQVQRILERYDDMHKGKVLTTWCTVHSNCCYMCLSTYVQVAIPHNIDRVVKSLAHIGRYICAHCALFDYLICMITIMGVPHRLSGTCRSDSRGIRDTIKSENDRLLNTVVHLVMNEVQWYI